MTGNAAVGAPGLVWARQSVWSQAANRLKAGIGRARAVGLGLTIAAAVLTKLATQVASLSSPAGKVPALAAAVTVGLVPVARSQLAPGSVAEWTRARSVSEALKSELYTFLTGPGVYRGADRERQLAGHTGQVLTDADDLLPYTAGLRPANRVLPAVNDVDTYLNLRLEPQLPWYTERAGGLQTRLTWVRYAELAR